MDEETWFTGDEAKSIGLADVVQSGEPDAQAKARFDLSSYLHVPDGLQLVASNSSRIATQNLLAPDQDCVQRAALMRKRFALVERNEQSR
jgi:hypothetical protein